MFIYIDGYITNMSSSGTSLSATPSTYAVDAMVDVVLLLVVCKPSSLFSSGYSASNCWILLRAVSAFFCLHDSTWLSWQTSSIATTRRLTIVNLFIDAILIFPECWSEGLKFVGFESGWFRWRLNCLMSPDRDAQSFYTRSTDISRHRFVCRWSNIHKFAS